MQLIVTSRLSEEENLWLKNITNHIKKRNTAEKLFNEYQKHQKEELYQSVMNIIIHANYETFKEEESMLAVLEELFKDTLEEKIQISIKQGKEKGELQNLLNQIQKKLQKGKSHDEIADELETDLYVVEQICEVLDHSEPDATQKELVDLLISKNILKKDIVSI